MVAGRREDRLRVRSGRQRRDLCHERERVGPDEADDARGQRLERRLVAGRDEDRVPEPNTGASESLSRRVRGRMRVRDECQRDRFRPARPPRPEPWARLVARQREDRVRALRRRPLLEQAGRQRPHPHRRRRHALPLEPRLVAEWQQPDRVHGVHRGRGAGHLATVRSRRRRNRLRHLRRHLLGLRIPLPEMVAEWNEGCLPERPELRRQRGVHDERRRHGHNPDHQRYSQQQPGLVT